MKQFLVFLLASNFSVSFAQLKTEDYDQKALGESQNDQTTSDSSGMDETTLKTLLEDLKKSKAAIDDRNKRLEKIMEEMDE